MGNHTSKNKKVREIPDNVGKLVRSQREKKGLKVYELADKVGVSPVYITQIEKHNKIPSPKIIDKISNALDNPSLFVSYATLALQKYYIKSFRPELLKIEKVGNLFFVILNPIVDALVDNQVDYKELEKKILPKLRLKHKNTPNFSKKFTQALKKVIPPLKELSDLITPRK